VWFAGGALFEVFLTFRVRLLFFASHSWVGGGGWVAMLTIGFGGGRVVAPRFVGVCHVVLGRSAPCPLCSSLGLT